MNSKEFLKIFEHFEIYEFDIDNTKDVKKLIKLLWEENAQLKKEYQTELDENCKLSELWKDSQVENRQLKSVLKEIRECIMNFLLTEEYIIVDGKAIANNYHELLEIIDKGIGVDINE